ncbi:MAG: hypothetical protein GY863_23940, partial [bacterium]|nr:hypothetical protein [bacterium]
MKDREKLRRMVDKVNDNLVKAHYFKTIGDVKTSQEWAAKEFAHKMALGLISGATKIKREYVLPPNLTREAASKAINKLLEKDDYEYSARLMKEFDYPEKTYVDTAVEAFNRYFKQMRFKKAQRIEQEFNIPNSRIQTTVAKVIKYALEKNKFELAANLGKEYKLKK